MDPGDRMRADQDRLTPELPRFVGLTPEEGEALAAELGAVLRAVPPDAVITMEYRPDRVTAVVADGRLVDPYVG